MFEKIVVGVDGHDGGRDALALAGVLGNLWDAEIVAVRAHLHGAADSHLAHLDALLHRDAELDLWDDLARTGVAATPRVTRDRSAAEALHRIAAEEGADLVVVGSTRHGPVGRVLVGDVSTATLHGAPCPVAVVPRGWGSAAAAPRAIAVGIAGERAPEPALDRAVAIAQRTGAPLTLLCVVPLPRDLTIDGAFVEDVRERYRLTNDALAHRVSHEQDVLATGLTVIGTPEEELAQLSLAVDLVVVGTHRSVRGARIETGHTTDRLVHHAACPVLVVPAAPDADPATPWQAGVVTGRAPG
jgi:nucleotide-binding universal stress UspA family protein